MSDDYDPISSKISLPLATEIARKAQTHIKTHFPEASPTIVVMPKTQAASGAGTSAAATAAPEVKRKRGRPRKVQVPPVSEDVAKNQPAASTQTSQAAPSGPGVVLHNGYELKMGEKAADEFVFWNCTTPGCGGTAMMKVGEKRLSDLEPHNAECIRAHSSAKIVGNAHAKNQFGGEPSSGEPTVKLQRKASPATSAEAQNSMSDIGERQSRASGRPAHGMRTRSNSRGCDSPSPELGAARRERSGSKSTENIGGVSPSTPVMRTRSSSGEPQSPTSPARPGPSSSSATAVQKHQITFRRASGVREVSRSAANRFVKPMTVHMKPHVHENAGFELEEEDEEEQEAEKKREGEEQADEDDSAEEADKDATAGAAEGAKNTAEQESDVAEDLDEEEVMLVDDEEMLAGLQETIAKMVSTSSGRSADKHTSEPSRAASRKSPMEGPSSSYAASSADAAAQWQRKFEAEKKAREVAERQRDHYKRELAKEAAGSKMDQANVLRKIKERADILKRCRELSSSRPDVPQPAPVTILQAAATPKSTAEASTITNAPPETRSAVTQTPAKAKPKPPPSKKDASTQMVARAKSSFGGHLLREETSNHAPKQKQAVPVLCKPDTRAKATDTDDLPQPLAPPPSFANDSAVPREPYPVEDNAMDVQQAQAEDEFGDMTIAEFWAIVKAECNGRTLEETYGRQE